MAAMTTGGMFFIKRIIKILSLLFHVNNTFEPKIFYIILWLKSFNIRSHNGNQSVFTSFHTARVN